MRKILFFVLIILGITCVGQNTNFDKIPDCESITHNTINELSELFYNNNLNSFDSIISGWIKICGISECTQRLIILNEILSKKQSTSSIIQYFENDFNSIFRNRMEDSKRINFGYIYSQYKAYYGFVPLRHGIDSIISNRASNLLENADLTVDERLICILFSGNRELFEKEIDKKEYNESQIKKHLLKTFRDNNNNWLAYTIYSGVFKPISSDDIFSYSPMLGLTFSSPLRNKLIVELGIKFRINSNDRSFKYYALGDTNMVNSDVSIFFGGLLSYKVFENDKLILLPKIGIGLESIDTGLSEKKENSQDKTYYNIETIHLSIGFSAMTPVLNKSYLGIGLNFHYCPYRSDKNLHSKIDNHLISTEIFWRF